MKQLARELEAHLRAVEILYTLSLNRAKQASHEYAVDKLEAFYPELIAARRNLGLFQVNRRMYILTKNNKTHIEFILEYIT